MTVTLDQTDRSTDAEGSFEAGGRLLDDLRSFLCRFVAFPEPEQADAVTLWIVHTYAFEAAEATPRLSIQSAEKQSGKTRLLELLDLLVRSSLSVASISAAAMFRLIAEGPTTLLIDEADTIFDGRGSGCGRSAGSVERGLSTWRRSHACGRKRDGCATVSRVRTRCARGYRPIARHGAGPIDRDSVEATRTR